MRKIFISYARDDDEPFVKRLYQELTAQGFHVWWDRVSMPSRALSFLQEIREAIDNIGRLIVVIGPRAVRSDYVRAEWQYALTQSKVVTPILRLGEYEVLPPELRNLHCPDFRDDTVWNEAIADLLRILNEPLPPLGSLYGVISPPPHYQPRPDDMTQLAETVLLDLKRPIVLTGAERVTVLHGMGGVGKSVLATTFARATETRRAFRDGVVWLNVGQHPDLVQNLREVGQAFGDTLQKYPDVQQGILRLSELLADKACLLILDDVWEVDHAEPFLNIIGTRCRLLITTRDGALATALGAREQLLDVLTDEAALRQLADWSEQPVEVLAPEAHVMAQECGNLPFALALCGAMVRDGITWSDLLEALRNVELTFMEKQFPNYPHLNVMRSLKVSVDVVEQTDPVGAKHYQELAVFPIGTKIPEAAVMTLWLHAKDLDEKGSRKLLTTLHRKALLRLEGNVPHRLVSLHQLQHDYLMSGWSDRPALHKKLLEAYRGKCPHDWPSGPNDGYFFKFLTYHLMEAEQPAEIHRLLALETADKRNAWYEAKEALADRAGYLGDVARAWRLSKAQTVDESTRPIAIGQQCRYALIATSLNSIAQMIPANLIPMLLEEGLWTPAQALEYTRQMMEPEKKRAMLEMLAPHLSEPLITEAVAIARSITDQWIRLMALTSLIGHIREIENQHLLREVLIDARVIPKIKERAVVVIGLALQAARSDLPAPDRETIIDEARTVVHETKDAIDRVWAMEGLTYVLSNAAREQTLREALAIARSIKNAKDRAIALYWLECNPYLSEADVNKVQTEALAAAREIKTTPDRVRILAMLASRLPEGRQKRIVLEALAVAQGRNRWSWLFRWKRKRPEKAIGEEGRNILLASLVPKLAEYGCFWEALETAMALNEWSGLRAQAITSVIPYFPETEKDLIVGAGLVAARNTGNLSIKLPVLANLAQYLPDTDRKQVLREALEGTRQIAEGDHTLSFAPILDTLTSSTSRAAILADIIPYLPESDRFEVLVEALISSKVIQDQLYQAQVLVKLSLHLSEDFASEAFAKVEAIEEKDIDERLPLLVNLAPLLPDVRREQALEEALLIARKYNEGTRAWVLAALASYLPDKERKQALHESRTAWETVSAEGIIGALSSSYPGRQALIMQSLKRDTNGISLLEAMAFKTAGQLELWKPVGIKTMLKLVSLLTDQHKEDLLPTILSAIRDIEEEYHRAGRLIELADHLPERLLPKMLEEAQGLTGNDDHAWVQAKIVSKLLNCEKEQMQVEKALTDAQTIKNGLIRIESLAWLLPCLPRSLNEHILQEVLASVGAIEDQPEQVQINYEFHKREIFSWNVERSDSLGRSLPQLASLGFLQEALTVALRMKNPDERTLLFARLTPYLIDLQPTEFDQLWQETLQILTTEKRRDLLNYIDTLATVIASQGGEQAVTETFHSIQDVGRWWP